MDDSTDQAAHPLSGRSEGRRTGLIDQIDRWTRLTTATFGLIVAGLLVLLMANRLVFEPAVRDSVEGTRVVRLIHEAMLDEETGLRGFLVTRDERYLEPYEVAAPTLPALLDEAKRRLTGDGTTAALLVDLRVAQQAWIDGWTGPALAAGRSGVGDVERDQLLDEGRALFDEYRTAYQALAGRLVAERTRALDRQNQALLFTALVALAITLLMGWLTLRRSRQLRATTDAGLAHLTSRLAAMGTGDLSPRAALQGPSELEALDTGLARTAAALAAARDHEEEQSGRVLTQNRNLAQVLRLAREVAGSMSLRYILRGVCDAAGAITGGRVVVWLRHDDGTLVARADTAGPGLEPLGHEPVPIGEGTVGRAARYGRVEGHASALLEGQPTGADGDDVAVPMVVGAEVTGVVQLIGSGAATLPTATLDVVEAMAVQAASAVASARLHEHTEALAMTDALTRLPNRRRLEADLAVEVAVSIRHGRPLAFAMLDVDHFKAYNDELGHQAADVALQDLAELLAASVRDGDTVYRYGGEELAVVLRETTADRAEQMVERLRMAVEHHFSAPGRPRPVTVSAGVAALPEHGASVQELVAAADSAMYDAKRAGRNRTSRAERTALAN